MKINELLPVRSLLVAAVVCAAMFVDSGASAASSALPDHRIGYVLHYSQWAVYQTPNGKDECPTGFNAGPREQFKAQFPDDGTKRTLAETHLAREEETWWPKLKSEPLEFKQAQGKVAYGLNLDGRIGPDDFTSPEGEQGIDNNMYRLTGCYLGHRTRTLQQIVSQAYNRIMIELTDVDDLVNDDDVTVTTYRGLDELLTDSTGNNYLPGGTQRVDTRWGKEFIYKTKGRIKDGVLVTEPIDYTYPAQGLNQETTIQTMKGMRFRLKLTPEKAEGLMGGYTDIEAYYRQFNQAGSTFHHGYGKLSAPTLYQALRRLADAYPDPQTGQNTAISSALAVSFVQVFVQHPRSVGSATDSVDGRFQ